jgi:predicted CXXCH cytochrome family protein
VRLAALALVAVLGAAVAAPAGGPSGSLEPHVEPGRGKQCIADPATMRRQHMTMLKHQRDDTVRAGVRGEPASLKACVECHASKATGSVAAARTDFCVSCHSYAAVKVDCFECHSGRPQGSGFHPLGAAHRDGGAKLAARFKELMAGSTR